MQVTIYHNPKCSKSRQTLELIRDANVTPTIVEYLNDTPDAARLGELLKLLGRGPRELMRHKEACYATLNLDDEGLNDDELIAAMVANPILIERPIVVAGDRAVLGRPPENVLDLLKN